MLELISLVPGLLLLLLSDYVDAGSYCQYSQYGSYYYCYGYCYGYYCDLDLDSYTLYVGSLSIGALIGVIIGCLVFLVLIITVIVIICASCTKSAGHRGRVVHPNTGLSVITGGQGQPSQFGYPVQPTAPPPYPGTGMGYYSTAPQPPPAYSGYGVNAPVPPPPSYSTIPDQGTSAK